MKKTDMVVGSLLLLMIGCESLKPHSPARIASLTVSIPPTSELKASMLGAASNELLYKIEGPGMTAISATIGPFSAGTSFGAIDFHVEVPGGVDRLLSLQLNDGVTHQPLAIGAAKIDLINSSPVTDIVVEMGSVTRNCYSTLGNNFAYGYTYGFLNDSTFFGQTNGPTYDVNFPYVYDPTHPGPATNLSGYYYFMADASANTYTASIAYMGNGQFVDKDFIPPDSQFSNSSMVSKAAFGAPVSDLQIGDIYCVKVNTIPGGHAWLQFTNENTFPNAPSFVFRINGNKPYFAYDRTNADIGNACGSTW